LFGKIKFLLLLLLLQCHSRTHV